MLFWLLHEGEAIGEVDAETSFAATAERAAQHAPVGACLVDLKTGAVVAHKAEVRPGVVAWAFADEGSFEADEARSVA